MSEIRATTISDAAGTGPITLTGLEAAKAAVAMTSAAAVAGNFSLNISSLSDEGVGDYRINFSNSFSGTYDYAGVSSAASNDDALAPFKPLSASQAQIIVINTSSAPSTYDKNSNAAVFGDLA